MEINSESRRDISASNKHALDINIYQDVLVLANRSNLIIPKLTIREISAEHVKVFEDLFREGVPGKWGNRSICALDSNKTKSGEKVNIFQEVYSLVKELESMGNA